MRKLSLSAIITNTKVDFVFIATIFLAAVLRCIRIDALTEFLGDQGRTMLVLYDWVNRGVAPLTGPTVLTGQPLGPVFYYLMVPGYILFGGEPTGMALWMVMFGIAALVCLYLVTRDLFGVATARLVTVLWAIAPTLVTADRVLWEPNLVPLFALVYLWSLIKLHRTGQNAFAFLHGATIGILVQLHYPNVFFAGLTGLYTCVLFLYRKRSIAEITKLLLFALLGAGVTLLPFLYHEMTVGFADLRQIGTIVWQSGSSGHRRRLDYLVLAVRFATTVVSRALPFTSVPILFILGLVWLAYFAVSFSFSTLFITAWFVGGVVAMTLYSGVVENHYLYFLSPVPFLMIAAVTHRIIHTKIAPLLLALFVVIFAVQIGQSDIFGAGRNDVARVRLISQGIMRDAGGKNYSFTILYGGSYSDLHYRYFFRRLGHEPSTIASPDYTKLFLVCDQSSCPTESDVVDLKAVDLRCYTPHCDDVYPKMPLTEFWKLQGRNDVYDTAHMIGAYFVFNRRK